MFFIGKNNNNKRLFVIDAFKYQTYEMVTCDKLLILFLVIRFHTGSEYHIKIKSFFFVLFFINGRPCSLNKSFTWWVSHWMEQLQMLKSPLCSPTICYPPAQCVTYTNQNGSNNSWDSYKYWTGAAGTDSERSRRLKYFVLCDTVHQIPTQMEHT